MNTTRTSASFFVVMGILALLSGRVIAQQPNFDAVQIQTLHVSGNIYMLVGAGGNIAVSVGEDGVLIVDDQFAPLTDKIVAAIRELSDGPIRFLVNTHSHGDHVGGNENLARMGALIFAHENTRKKMAEGGPDDRTPDPNDSIPPEPRGSLPIVTLVDRMSFHINGEDVDLIYPGPAHTDGDIFVFFRGSNVLHVGDVLVTEGFPVIDRASHGNLEGIISALNLALDLVTTAPGFLSGRNNQPGAWPDPSNGARTDTLIIPGHGRLYDEADLVQYRDMVVIIRDRIIDLIDKGLTLEEVKAADPTLGWNNWYGSTTPPFTTERFIETAYAELSQRR